LKAWHRSKFQDKRLDAEFCSCKNFYKLAQKRFVDRPLKVAGGCKVYLCDFAVCQFGGFLSKS
jgi:hypothetical protein